MRIADTCPCGAQIDVTEDWAVSARTTHTGWLRAHQQCREQEHRNLVRWKAEALEVLAGWEECWEAAGRPGQLGESKAVAVRRLLEEWRDQEIVSIKPLGPRSRFTWDQQTGGTS